MSYQNNLTLTAYLFKNPTKISNGHSLNKWKSAKEFEETWLRLYKKEIKRNEQNIDASALSYYYNRKPEAHDGARRVMFKSVWLLEANKIEKLNELKTCHNDFLEQLRSSNSTHPTVKLDKLSLKLLELYKQEKICLKLSLSRIINTMNKKHFEIMKEVLEEYHLADNMAFSYIEEEEKKMIESFFDKIIKMCKEEELKEYKKNRGNSLTFQLVKVAKYILENLEYWKKYKFDSEDEQVHRVKGLLRIIFRDAKTLKIQTGEHTSSASKIIQRYNEENFGNFDVFLSSSSATASTATASTATASTATASTATAASSSSKIIGRKVDMMLVGSNNTELAICEFKVGENGTKLEAQEGKCLRLNAGILKRLKCLREEEEEVVAFVWGGMSGELFSLRQDEDGVMIARSLSKLLLPWDIRLIDEQFKQSIIALYNWKAFLTKQDDRLELTVPGIRSYCPETPEICFSPKRQK